MRQRKEAGDQGGDGVLGWGAEGGGLRECPLLLPDFRKGQGEAEEADGPCGSRLGRKTVVTP